MSDDLLHYGIPGMKWGVRKMKARISAPKYTSREIRDARSRTLSSRSREIKNATSFGKKVSIALLGEYSPALSLVHRASPDRKIAMRFTNGEKAIHAFAAVVSGGMSAPVTGLTAGLQGSVVRDQKRASELLLEQDK